MTKGILLFQSTSRTWALASSLTNAVIRAWSFRRAGASALYPFI